MNGIVFKRFKFKSLYLLYEYLEDSTLFENIKNIKNLKLNKAMLKRISYRLVLGKAITTNIEMYTIIKLNEDHIVCGGVHKSGIQIWNFKKGILIKHIDCIGASSMARLSNTQFASAINGCIDKWDAKSGSRLKTLEHYGFQHHGQQINCLLKIKNQLYSAGYARIIEIWNYSSGVCEKELSLPEGPIMSLVRLNEKQIACCNKMSVLIWDIIDYTLVTTINGIDFHYFYCKVDGLTKITDNILAVSGSLVIRIYDLLKKERYTLSNESISYYEYNLHIQNLIRLNSRHLIGVSRGDMTVWDYQEGTIYKRILYTFLNSVIKINEKQVVASHKSVLEIHTFYNIA